MKDLRIEYRDIHNKFVKMEYNTIMDFLDEMQEKERRETIKNASYIHYTLFENQKNSGFANNINELYSHCEKIVK